MAKIDDRIVILLKNEADGEYGHIYANTHVQNDGSVSGHDVGAVLNPSLGSRYGWDAKYGHLDRLRTSAQYDVNNPSDIYGWDVEYANLSYIGLKEADEMAKALRRITTAMYKAESQYGYPATYGEYVSRFAAAIGCQRFGVHTPELRADGTPYRWFDASGMRRWIAEIRQGAKESA